MKKSTPHLWEEAAQEMVDWLDQGPEEVAASFSTNGRAPFSAPASERQKLEYYQATLFNTDGSPNEEARSQTMERVGPRGYFAIMHALGQDKAKETEPNLAFPDGEVT